MADIQSFFHHFLTQEYEGDTHPDSGAFHGRGKLWMKSGHVYDGTFENGWLHGQGTVYWQDGTIYTGDFDKNRATGKCEIEW